MSEIGARVTAIRNVTASTVYVYGEGVYEGNLPHPTLGIRNPCIKLDDGTVIWGMECWWGDVDKVKEKFSDKETVVVPFDRTAQG